MSTIDLVAPLPPAVAVPGRGPSISRLTTIEIRKSLSTRSGRAVAASASMVAPHWIPIVLLTGQDLSDPPGMLAELGMLTGLLMLALGVLSTAGEWTHRTLQTTFLAVPRRERVLAAKALAMALLGAAYSAMGLISAVAILAVWGPSLDWGAVATSVAVGTAGGAAFTVMGAGIGAAVCNAPAALTGTYLTLLVAPPLLHQLSPTLAEALDPGSAVIQLASGNPSAVRIATLTGWLVVTSVAGAMITHRRAVA
ncbi:hypothetical protein [Streptosporangium sp. NPDC087985]|uniref:hypothetical protein n=1 Tax=Streptosporangium sp. NPDC087985 TaxID=3366196 RepID=UPI0037FB4BB0